MIEVHSGGFNKKYKIGYCQNSNISQAFSLLQIVGGRVDSQRGLEYLSLNNKANVSGKAVFKSYNNGIYVYNINNVLEVYASLETYVYLQVFAFNYITARFIFDVQEVSDFPSSDYRVFNNSFTEM
jgi:hypothetical protein